VRTKKYQIIVSAFIIPALFFLYSGNLKGEGNVLSLLAANTEEKDPFSELTTDNIFKADKRNPTLWGASIADSKIFYFVHFFYLPINFYCYKLFAYLNCTSRSPNHPHLKN